MTEAHYDYEDTGPSIPGNGEDLGQQGMEEVTAFRTSDGTLHESKAKAVLHQFGLDSDGIIDGYLTSKDHEGAFANAASKTRAKKSVLDFLSFVVSRGGDITGIRRIVGAGDTDQAE